MTDGLDHVLTRIVASQGHNRKSPRLPSAHSEFENLGKDCGVWRRFRGLDTAPHTLNAISTATTASLGSDGSGFCRYRHRTNFQRATWPISKRKATPLRSIPIRRSISALSIARSPPQVLRMHHQTSMEDNLITRSTFTRRLGPSKIALPRCLSLDFMSVRQCLEPLDELSISPC